MQPIRVLFLADTHLGFDLPLRPQVRRRRRGHDFQANFELALGEARAGKVDLVVHGGDLFHRSRVPPSLAFQGLRPLVEVAEMGVPVFLVPGNHERSRIPHARFGDHPNLHIFHRPQTVMVPLRGHRVAVTGFPYHRNRIRERFPEVLEESGWQQVGADVRLLCMHHCVEGATVGPSDYTFRDAPDVIRRRDFPTDFQAVLSGHIHRHQVLRPDRPGSGGFPPVFYPGSVERTAFAEVEEEKGFILLILDPEGEPRQRVRHQFCPLPSRPMSVRDLHPPQGQGYQWRREDLEILLRAAVEKVPADAVFRIRVHGQVPPGAASWISARRIRCLAPSEMNVEVRLVDDGGRRPRDGRRPMGGTSDGAAAPRSRPLTGGSHAGQLQMDL